jgi:tetratricopeptide (TPR) repeat protein
MAMRYYNASLKSYNEAVNIQSNKTSAWSGLTNAYSALNNYAKASAAASSVTQLDPKNKANWLKEGNLLLLDGYFDKAAARYDGALAIDPKYTMLYTRKDSRLWQWAISPVL